ncbi:MAG: hypothetical protein ABJG86_21440 [Nitratireductor sp.]|jgi:quinol monooxygenase YgiN
MRSITIRYQYSGPEEEWRGVIDAFVAAIDADEAIAGRFAYQVAIAEDGRTRIHWGRWDSAETLNTMQSRDYFKVFAERLRKLAGGPPDAVAADVTTKTVGW